MNESGDAGGGGDGGGGGSSGGCGGGDDDSGGGGSWWNAGVGINGVLWKRADLATGVTCRDDQCRRSDSTREKFQIIFLHRETIAMR